MKHTLAFALLILGFLMILLGIGNTVGKAVDTASMLGTFLPGLLVLGLAIRLDWRSKHDKKGNGLSKAGIIVALPVISIITARAGVDIYYSLNPDHKLENILGQTATSMNNNLPKMVDQDTRLDMIIGGPEKTLTYNYTLINHTSSDLDMTIAYDDLAAIIQTNVCTSKTMKTLFDQGARALHIYHGSDGKEVLRIEINSENCDL